MIIEFARNDNGSFTNAVTVNRGVSADPACRNWLEAWNASSSFHGDASHIGYSNGCKIIRGVLIINLVEKSEAVAIQEFFANIIAFVKPFFIGLSLAGGADLGNGSGTSLYECFVDGPPSTENMVIPLGRGGKYTVTIPYVCFDLITVEGAFP